MKFKLYIKRIKSSSGFAMAELLAVCVAMLVIFSVLFSNYLPLVAEYENRIGYNDITSQYAAHYLRKMYMNSFLDTSYGEERKNLIEDGINKGSGFFTVYNEDLNKVCDYVLDKDKSFCENIVKKYNIEEMIITKYKPTDVKNGYKSGSLKSYITYLPSYKEYNGAELYRIIIKTSYGYATTPIISENINRVKEKICTMRGPYSSGTKTTQYAYYDDKVYYDLYCSTEFGFEEKAVNVNNIKSSNENLLTNIKIVDTSTYENSETNKVGYKYRIEATVKNYKDLNDNVYLSIDEFKIVDRNGIYNEEIKSNSINLGLISTNVYKSDRDILGCNKISKDKEKAIEDILSKRIEKVGTESRQAVVEAARFLAIDFPYVIPYYSVDDIKTYPTAGVYVKKGLYLNADYSGGNEDTPWGCDRVKQKSSKNVFEVGKTYKNGLDSSSYISWSLINGGFVDSGAWDTEIFDECSSGCDLSYQRVYNSEDTSSSSSNIFDSYMSNEAASKAYSFWNKLNPSSKKCIRGECGLSDYNEIDNYDIKAGDLVWKKDNIGIVIGVKTENNKKVYAIAESTYLKSSEGEFNPKGLIVSNYSADQLYELSGYTHVIKMDDIYGDKNSTNYKAWW